MACRLFEHGTNGAPCREHIRSLVEPFVLRRIKTDVMKELVPKVEKKDILGMTPRQRDLYLSLLTTATGAAPLAPAAPVCIDIADSSDDDVVLVQASAAATSNVQSFVKPAAPPAKQYKHLFTELRKAANHPLLLCNYYNSRPAVRICIFYAMSVF